MPQLLQSLTTASFWWSPSGRQLGCVRSHAWLVLQHQDWSLHRVLDVFYSIGRAALEGWAQRHQGMLVDLEERSKKRKVKGVQMHHQKQTALALIRSFA
jgi:hypothetical protein